MANISASADHSRTTRRKDWSPRLPPVQLRFPMACACCRDFDPGSPLERQYRHHLGWVELREAYRHPERPRPAWIGFVPREVVMPEPEPEMEWPDLYFIGGDQGPIKIGISVDPTKRLKGLQTGYPYALSEPDYHERFTAHRLEGEWFERHPDILAEIERLNTLRRG